jgi:hypothetical protein
MTVLHACHCYSQAAAIAHNVNPMCVCDCITRRYQPEVMKGYDIASLQLVEPVPLSPHLPFARRSSAAVSKVFFAAAPQAAAATTTTTAAATTAAAAAAAAAAPEQATATAATANTDAASADSSSSTANDAATDTAAVHDEIAQSSTIEGVELSSSHNTSSNTGHTAAHTTDSHIAPA